MSLNLILIILLVFSIALAVFTTYNFFINLKDSTNIYQEAMQMVDKGKYVDARGLLRSRLNKNPHDALAHFYLSKTYNIEGNDEQELHHLRELRRTNNIPKELDPIAVFSRAAYLHYEAYDLAGAFENFLTMLEFDSQNEMALAHIGFLAIGQQEFQVAEKYFSPLVEIAPDVKEYHIARAVGLAMLKQERAIEAFDKAIEIDPEDYTSIILKALECFRQNKSAEGYEAILSVIEKIEDKHILYIAHKIAVVLCYLEKNYSQALTHAEFCERSSKQNAWSNENHDALLSIALLSILANELPRAAESLLELEIASPADEKIIALSNFRVELADNRAQLNEVSPHGFNFAVEMETWLRTRFPDNSIYKLSGLEQSESFEVLQFFNRGRDLEPKMPELAKTKSRIDDTELIERFKQLDKEAFQETCQKIIALLGFKTLKNLNYREEDGEDYLGQNIKDAKIQALFRIRKWSNQAISDIFLREQQVFMNEQNANLGFVIASTQLTSGANEVLKNLKKITVINEEQLAGILGRVL